MSEELEQNDLVDHGVQVGKYEVYNIGGVTLKQLATFGIIPKRDYGKYAPRKPDLLIINKEDPKNPEVIVTIERKTRKEFNTKEKKIKAVQQGNDLAQILNSKIGIATDGDSYVWFNPRQENKKTTYKDKTTKTTRSYTCIQYSDGSIFSEPFFLNQKVDEPDVEKLDDLTCETYETINRLYGLLDKNNSIVTDIKSINPLPLAKSVWQKIWIATGKEPEKCLYNVVEIFIFKFLSDLEILEEPENFEYMMSLYAKGKSDKFVINYYAKNCRQKIFDLFPLSKHDNTSIINGTIFVDSQGNAMLSQAILFNEVLHKFKEFEKHFGKFKKIDKEFKTKLYETFLKQTQGLKGLGQYFTPRKVIQSMIQMSDIQNLIEGQRVCDPFCGVGGFVLEPLNMYDELKSNFIPQNKKIINKIIHIGYDKGFEKDDERTIILAKANMLIYLSDIIVNNRKLTKKFATVFNDTFRLLRTNVGSLGLILKEGEKFDLILTNPPYVTKGKKTILNEIKSNGKLSKLFPINGIGIEGLALEWIITNLKPKGSAFVIIPEGMLNRISDKSLRNHILDTCHLNAIISLPKRTFFATSKKTYILAITKKSNKKEKQIIPVFTYLIKDIGEKLDITRFDINENDLPPMVSLYNQFKGSKDTFKSKDKKCKIQSINKFVKDPSWVVDRWWTDKEKHALGIIESEEVYTINEFKEKLIELQTSLKESSIELDKLQNNNNYNFHKITIGSLFDLEKSPNSSKFTRSFVDQHKGEIPVYSASKDANSTLYGHVKDNLANIKYYEKCLTWNIDGYIGKAFYRDDRFTLSEKVIPLVLQQQYEETIDYEYVKFILEKEAKKKDLGFSNKAGKSRIKDIEIKIPVKENMDKNNDLVFDLDAQKILSSNYMKIEEIQQQIQTELENMQKISVEI